MDKENEMKQAKAWLYENADAVAQWAVQTTADLTRSGAFYTEDQLYTALEDTLPLLSQRHTGLNFSALPESETAKHMIVANTTQAVIKNSLSRDFETFHGVETRYTTDELLAAEQQIFVQAAELTAKPTNGQPYADVKEIKEVKRGRIKEYLNSVPAAVYLENNSGTPAVYTIKSEIVLPCATENDIDLETAKLLVQNGLIALGEGANMPTTKEAFEYFLENNILFAPGKAANAGGVAVSALEMSQNSMRYFWTFEEVDKKLEEIMANIFTQVKNAVDEYALGTNYLAGANIAAFRKVANAMIAQGVI